MYQMKKEMKESKDIERTGLLDEQNKIVNPKFIIDVYNKTALSEKFRKCFCSRASAYGRNEILKALNEL